MIRSENCFPTAIGSGDAPTTPIETLWGFGSCNAPTYESTKAAWTTSTTESAAMSNGIPVSLGFGAVSFT